MHGAIIVSKNIRRTGIPASKRGKRNPDYLADGPTQERLAKAEGFFVVGGEDRGIRGIYTMRDSPVERAFRKGDITETEQAALRKYHHHFYHSGLEAGVGSVDLNRIFSSDPGSMSGMAKTEAQAFHRGKYREARELIGHKTGIVVDNVLCNGTSLEIAGYAIGYNSPFRAREGAMKHLKRAGDMLERHWGFR